MARMDRVDAIVLLKSFDRTGPRGINLLSRRRAAAINGKKYNIDPQRQMYALQWCTTTGRPTFICSWYQSLANGSIRRNLATTRICSTRCARTNTRCACVPAFQCGSARDLVGRGSSPDAFR